MCLEDDLADPPLLDLAPGEKEESRLPRSCRRRTCAHSNLRDPKTFTSSPVRARAAHLDRTIWPRPFRFRAHRPRGR